VACWGTKAAISLKRVKIEETLLYGGPIGSHQRSFDFLGRRHISTSGLASTATEMAVFALFFARTAQQSVLDNTNGLSRVVSNLLTTF